MQHRIRKFFEGGLWDFHLSEEKGWRRFKFKWLRIAYLSARGFYQDKCTLRASSLTYYTLMSIVPVLAMSFAIARGFGYNEHLKNELLARFQEQQAVLTELFSFTEKLLEQTRGGVIAGVGLAILFWSVSQLLSSMEDALNHIWGIKNSRSWRRILSDYFALMLIGPFLFVLSSSVTVFLVGELTAAVDLLPIGELAKNAIAFFLNLIPYCLFWVLFSFIYLFMPNTKVRFKSAILGGIAAALLYVIVQWGYIYFQIGVNRYGAIYGSFAALPLFLIWVQLSWFILFFGAEISYAHQTLEEHEFQGRSEQASYGFKRLLSLWVVHLTIARFLAHQSPLNLDLLVHRHQIPHALAKTILEELTLCGLLMPVASGYFPARPADSLRISDVIQALEGRGTSDFPFIDSKALAPFERALEHFREQIEKSPENKPLSHVPHKI